MALSIGDRRLGAILLEQGYVNDNDLQRALDRHGEVGGRLSDILIDTGLVGAKRIARAVEEALGIPLVNLVVVQPTPEALAVLPAKVAQTLLAVPFAVVGGNLRVAFVDPLNSLTIETVEDECGMTVEPYQALREQVQWAIAHHYPELGLDVPQPTDGSEGQGEQLGARLVRRGYVSQEDLDAALVKQKELEEPLGTVLVHLGALTEEQLYMVLAEQANVIFIRNPRDYEPDEATLGLLLRAEALRLSAVPLEEKDGVVTVVTSDPRRREEIERVIGRPLQLALSRPNDVENLIERLYPQKGRLGEAMVQQGTLSRSQLREALQVQSREGRVKPLGEVIVELGYAGSGEIEEALEKQHSGGGRLEDTLVQSGKISPEMLARSLAVQLGYEFLDGGKTTPDAGVATLVPEATARRYSVMPIRMQGGSLVVAMKDPRNVFALDDLRIVVGRDIVPAVMAEKDITRLIERTFGGSDMAALNKELAASAKAKESARDEADLNAALDDNAVVRVVDNIIREAALQEASDIHIEPGESSIKVRLRIDGALREYQELPKASGASIVARIKIIGQLDIAEKRVPQDGRVRFKRGSIDLDLRLSTLPTVYGEKIVMRLLQKASNIPEVEQLGFSEHNYQRFIDTIEKPYGIFLITGPTGSGKSFSTFSILKRISTPDSNTTTIEDPVEYEIPGINQTQVNNAAGLTFARALRSFLRQDPDIIMVGEIRDTETAQIATEAALTGHLVIATLHTNDAPGAITRLEEMGVESFNIGAALIGVLGQRLVRKICQECKIETTPDPEVLRKLGIPEEQLDGAKLYRGAGCTRCNGTGYRGRMAIHELMVVDDSVRRAVSQKLDATGIREVARRESHMRTLREDGLEKAMAGLTTLEEILGNTNA
ncbi:ATPase, T2SS/T4P/T4SS family [Deinococcus peraridilitoris]|uniref:Type II secretory pathway, ATPase PulE/Tfp pilus assembly pathway, ATPase PilB n=1 Tax=Deinococcus peraridilitoris (strain DSM 19664 / LMG 22246 / CIP 109416 / KR-200) TaxID=937777 RepID=L0A1E6_DEIPD|nr:ATPase, T2SS/T4P/T4SS family [Deinococcus peraridilitoris]AFZ67641.1 type II secretory pathway, ATPase PulE/Tfp pilus assembly pathway, ATPase PilB [Deinococcus peraridilitoris DSM 19664]